VTVGCKLGHNRNLLYADDLLAAGVVGGHASATALLCHFPATCLFFLGELHTGSKTRHHRHSRHNQEHH